MVSMSGGWMSAIRPHSKRLWSRSSIVGIWRGGHDLLARGRRDAHGGPDRGTQVALHLLAARCHLRLRRHDLDGHVADGEARLAEQLDGCAQEDVAAGNRANRLDKLLVGTSFVDVARAARLEHRQEMLLLPMQ